MPDKIDKHSQTGSRPDASAGAKLPEEWYQLLFEMANDLLFIRPLSTSERPANFIDVNQAACRILGYSREELLQLSPMDLVLEQERQTIPEEIKTISADKKLLFEKTLITKDGAQIPVELHTRLFEFEGQSLVLTIARDITQRKQNEDRLGRYNAELKRHLEGLTALNQVAQTVATATNLPVALDTVGRTLTRLLDGSGTMILLLDETRSTLQVVSHARLKPHPLNFVGQTFPVEDEVVRQIIQDKQALVISDAQSAPVAASIKGVVQQLGIESVISLPLLVRDEAIGLIVVGRNKPAPIFSPADVRLAKTIAGQIAVAVQIARLFDEEQHQRQVAESLREVAMVLNSSLELETVLENIFDQLSHIVHFDGGAVFLVDNDELVVWAGVGEAVKVHLTDRISLLSQNPGARVFKQQKPLIINQGESEPHWMDWTPSTQIYAWMGAPLLVGASNLGVLTVDSYAPYHYTQAEADILQVFANQAALAINNARLHKQSQQDAETKAVLLQEIHHRVKNNFQIVSSILSFQIDSISDPDARMALKESQHRIRTMAMIHEQLYRFPNLAQIGFSDYAKRLTRDLFEVYRDSLSHPVQRKLAIDNSYLPIKMAIPCGLIINELVSNALKYAFPADWEPGPDSECEIVVRLRTRHDGQSELTVSDNGIGLPAGMTPAAEDSLGLFLVEAFVQQLAGSVRWRTAPNQGTECRILFSTPDYLHRKEERRKQNN